jgi:hypothetical protein
MIFKTILFAASVAGVAQLADMARNDQAHLLNAQKKIVAEFTPGIDGRLPPPSPTVAGYATDPMSILR